RRGQQWRSSGFRPHKTNPKSLRFSSVGRIRLSSVGNYREHFIYRRDGCLEISFRPPGGHDMKIVLRDDESGVSEVVGTILILAMTVVLFSSIILWVGSIPTPTTQTRVDLRPSMIPVYDGSGNEIGVNITILHRGVERLNPGPTLIYVQSQRVADPPATDKRTLHKFGSLPPGATRDR